MSSVTATSRRGSSGAVIGLNRVSSRAAVIAYEERPVASGCDSKVPIQPRRERVWEVAETRFQVTKRGVEVRLADWAERAEGDWPTGWYVASGAEGEGREGGAEVCELRGVDVFEERREESCEVLGTEDSVVDEALAMGGLRVELRSSMSGSSSESESLSSLPLG